MFPKNSKFQELLFLLCCVKSTLSTCIFEGEVHREGETWNSTCNVCSCFSSTISCTKTACSAVACQPGETLMHQPNECCPQCLPYKRPCNVDSLTFAHNDVWSSGSKCILYQCHDGVSVPFVIQCPPLYCIKGEVPFTASGECCPVCSFRNCEEKRENKTNGLPSVCSNDSASENCGSKSVLKENLMWKSPCTFCLAENGYINCYSQKCQDCLINTSSNDLCCPCIKDICDKSCLKCLDNDTQFCTHCKEPLKVLHKGKCLDSCPNGFFEDDSMQCASCPPNCRSCFGNMTSQCTSCKNGFLLQKGRCIETCDVNFYESNGHCFECHTSCSSCVGPSEEECVACALSGQLLQDGKCVDNCDGHFYISEDGYCLSCNETCVRCLKNGTCQYCERGFYLQDGVCLPECYPGYYLFLDAYCLPCHEECQECFGPLPFQCTSCPFNQYLLKNSCVDACGQGYYGDLGAGLCRPCHPKCRNCLDTSSDDKCLSCSNGYLLPYIGTHFGPCVENCPDQYYLMESGICDTCHETCETCFGPNETECLSCNKTLFYKNGACVPHCSTGYFGDDGVCYACHPSCSTCHGFTENDCYTCPHGRKLKYGKCVPVCPEGKYSDLKGLCADCHSSCSDCYLNPSENKTVHCIKCKNQQYSIYKDECIPECSSIYYLNSHNTCTECHSSCATCERTGATSCASCWAGNFLTHLDTCERQCHPGYFSNDGICEPCSSDCYECISTTQCIKCKGDLVLQFGKCVSGCSVHSYLDTVTRQCKECSEECSSCRGPLASDCLSCYAGKLFEDGICVNQCSERFFQDGNICKTCDLQCKTCSSLNTCTSCDSPYFLLKNDCVDDCGAGYYPEYETQYCKECSVGCIACVSSDYCALCFNGYFLMNFECVSQCPQGYLSDSVLRICQKNEDIPSLHINSILKTKPAQKILISASVLSVSDNDSDSLFVSISQLPNNVILIKMSEKGEEILLHPGGNFTSVELNDGWIFFKHLQGIPLKGDIVLKVSDGQLISDEVTVPLVVFSEFPPFIEHIRNIILIEDSSLMLNTTYFSIKDIDNPNDVILQVVQNPCSAKLILLPEKKQIQTFTYKEFVQNKLILKASKKTDVHDDKLIIQVSDGFNSVIAEIRLFILPKDQKELYLLRNNPLLVKLDEFSELTNDHIYAISQESLPSNIVFTLEKSSVTSYGSFYKVLSNSKKNKKISSAKISFSQKDIDERLILYKHSDNLTTNVIIPTKVSNTKTKAELNFNLQIKALLSDHAVILPDKTNEFGMMVLQNHPAAITNDHLQIQLDAVPIEDIVYMITKKLAKEEGFLENVDKPGYRIHSFTQKDIDDLKIIYHPPPYLEASENNYSFQFIILDAKRKIQLSPVQNFTITVRPQSSEFTSPSSSVDHVTTIVVPQGQSVELGSHWLSTVGHQMPEDQLEVVLTIAPQYGNLTQILNGYDLKIEEEDGFSFTSIIHDTSYTHDGSNNFKDYAVFKIMGGPFSSVNRIDFMISPNDKESPVLLDSTSLMAFVVEGNYLDLRRNHLAYTDLVSADHDIIFTIMNKPTSGNLTKLVNGDYITLQKGDTFTQQDINDQLIRFYAREPIGNNTIKENLYFDVSDGSGNVQPNQPLLMKVKPKIRKPPVVKVTTDVKVNEGGEAIIEPHVITVFDPDSHLSDLIVYIDKQPEYGFIENSRPIPGAEKSLAGIPISAFSYIDLLEGYIKYIQLTHRDVEPERDNVTIHINDGFLSSSSHLVNITIKPMNDEAPLVRTHPLTVLQGSFVKVLNSSLSVTDEDTTPDQLYIRLANPPKKGEIRLMASNNYNLKNSKALLKQDTFTFQDVLEGLIMYVHENVNTHENDSFSFTISDGYHDIADSIDIYIIVRDREVPYLERNLGLELSPGESSIIDNKVLSALDSDSPVESLKFVLITDPSSGELFLKQNGNDEKVSSAQNMKINYFTQSDINNGKLFYRHSVGNPVGLHYFGFNVIDPANNTLMDQKFFISIFEDLFPPFITVNTGLEVKEKNTVCINSSMLAAVDEHQKDTDLIFTLTSLPTYGYLAMKTDIGKPITSFLMSDINVGQICYVHKSERHNFKDNFIFTVSDGKNYILQSFHINITLPYKSLPFIRIYPLFLDEGSQKAITEFEIDIYDRDSVDSELILMIISPPTHGKVIDFRNVQVNQFSYEDIRLGLISYVHDGSDTTIDNFTLLITDGSNEEFIISDSNNKNISLKDPFMFLIKIFPVDDAYPVLLKNEGLQTLKKDSEKVWNIISEDILLTGDVDTEKDNILYHITVHPHFGFLELTSHPDRPVFQFTQRNIENQELMYVLKNDDFAATEDKFIFSVEDTNPNKLFNNIFMIRWTRIHFISSSYNISETSGLLELPVKRIGNRHLDFTASCRIAKVDLQSSYEHLVAIVNEIHFRANDVMKFCVFRVIDNKAFEDVKEFKILLKSNISLLASPHVAKIFITDAEDEPTLSFKEGIFKVNETDKYFEFPIIRQGDLNQEMSVLCNTSDVTARGSNGSSLQTGSDYRSRDSSYDNFITFDPGVIEMMCIVKVIDDNLFEEEEEFLLRLSKPHPVGKIVNHTLAHVIIQGPNDAPYVFIQDKQYEIFYGEQNSSVTIVRQGPDISGASTVWCWSYLLSENKSVEMMNSYYQIFFEPFESSAACFVPTNSLKQKTQKIAETILISLDSPSGCLIGEPNKIHIPLMKKVINPVIEFKLNQMTVLENVGSINIPIQRTGDISSSATLHCITQDGTAQSQNDFQERYITRKDSLIHFNPGRKESFCSINIYDDDKYEGTESFQVLLIPFEKENEMVTIGLRKTVTIEIIDIDDVTVIEFEKPHYLVTQNSFPNSSVSAVLSVVRQGDISLLSKVRISTIDGSAASGLDYYPKSKIYSFLPGEKEKKFEIEILYNKRRNWALSFLVILGPDDVMNAEIGNISKTIVTIPRVESIDSLILPTVPIVVSLIFFDDVKKGMSQDAKYGYPLICITPCDINYPDYASTSILCRASKINASSLIYSWEISMPQNNEENSSPFKKITHSTLFTSANGKVLDSIYFRPHEKVRCIVQPVDSQGHIGISLRSQSIRISPESGFCQTSNSFQYLPASLASQPFIATLNYVNSSDGFHPNKLHIHIEIPHEDGLLPLLSTYPLHNIEFLLMHSVYRQQHVCSNLLHTEKSFMKSLHPQFKDIKSAFPYHPEEILKEMQLLYQHLNLRQCKWSFDAWYSMSDLTELCGGSVTSEFKTHETDKTYVSVSLPLYVTYVFAAAPTGWTTVEHRTEIEFSFFYDTFLWRAGSYSDGTFNASLTMIRIGTDTSGHLFFEFKTVAKFHGCFVMEHHTLPGIKSHLTVPDELNVKFNLQLLWSEQSFDGPTQIWKATSNYNLKDYSGRYIIHLIPCEVTHDEQLVVFTEMQFLPCLAQAPQKFELPITFQQTLRPQPVTYSLETYFQLFNEKKLFLLNPFEKHKNFQYIEYKGAFSKGEKVYGRVFWSPEQELESAYQLKITEVLVCSGKNGFVPLYDPTGKIYHKGAQYGCLLHNKNLQHKFILLDRHHPDITSRTLQGLPFNAEFIEDSLEYEKLHKVNGVDGFVFSINPLHELSSSQQWFLQVTYSIKPIPTSRIRRSLENTEKLLMEENLTNIKMLLLKVENFNSSSVQFQKESRAEAGFGVHHIMYLISAILIVLGILILGYRNPSSTVQSSSRVFEKYYKYIDYKRENIRNENYYDIIECRQKVKQIEKCKTKVPKLKDKVYNYLVNSKETEV